MKKRAIEKQEPAREPVPLFASLMAPGASAAAAAVLESGWTGQGEVVKSFETKLQALYGLPNAPITVCSGTAALDLAYHLAEVDGGRVIVAAMTCAATVTPLVHRGCTILYADVHAHDGTIDVESVKRLINEHKGVSAIVAVDYGGRLCDYRALRAFGVPVIQDAAHNHAPVDVNNCGDYVCWSFQSIKTLTTVDGGALWCDNRAQLERGRVLRWFGLDRETNKGERGLQRIHEAGYKYHMHDVAAAIGCVNAEMVPDWISQMRGVAMDYRLHLRQLSVGLPAQENSTHWLFPLVFNSEREKELARRMLTKGKIGCGDVHMPVYRHPGLITGAQTSDAIEATCPGAREFAATQLCVPCGPWVTVRTVEYVAAAVRVATRLEGA